LAKTVLHELAHVKHFRSCEEFFLFTDKKLINEAGDFLEINTFLPNVSAFEDHLNYAYDECKKFKVAQTNSLENYFVTLSKGSSNEGQFLQGKSKKQFKSNLFQQQTEQDMPSKIEDDDDFAESSLFQQQTEQNMPSKIEIDDDFAESSLSQPQGEHNMPSKIENEGDFAESNIIPKIVASQIFQMSK
jgi:hypothetical protein